MSLEEKVKSYAESHLPSSDYFLVDVIVKGTDPQKVLILLDGDNGVNIDACAALSRKVAADLEEEEVIEHAFTLNVSSPGLEHPIKLKRQYINNVGRRVKVLTTENKEIVGELMAVNEETIVVNAEGKNGKKTTYKEQEIDFKEINKTNTLVSFK